MTSYFTSNISIFTSQRQVQIQTTSEMTPYFTKTKCNKLFITYPTRLTTNIFVTTMVHLIKEVQYFFLPSIDITFTQICTSFLT